MNNSPPILEVKQVRKSYAAPVLIDFDLDIRAGEVHALVGANGAGKSTFARIVSGLTSPDTGTLRLDGKRYAPENKRAAERLGVHLVLQELNLVNSLTVAENIFFNCLPRRCGFIKFADIETGARKALARVGLDGVDPRTRVGRLGVGQRQLIEIAAALSHEGHLLILDEPTAALTAPQIDRLFEQIDQLKQRGMGLLYISHRMEEIRRIADRVTVLRDGRKIATHPAADVSTDQLVREMTGRALQTARHREVRLSGRVKLQVRHLSRGDRVRDVSFDVHAGEIFGLAGLIGSGRTETLRALFGADPPDQGEIRLAGSACPLRIRKPADAVRAGMGMIPEDRKEDGLLLPHSIRVNATLSILSEMSRAGGWIQRSRESFAAESMCRQLDVQSQSIEQPARELSGGNQQKVVIARWLLRQCEVLLFDEPTRGIDVGAKATVYNLLDDLAKTGAAIVMVSSELDELTALCDRIGVMSAGRLVAIFKRGEWTEEKLMAAAFQEYLKTKTEAQQTDEIA